MSSTWLAPATAAPEWSRIRTWRAATASFIRTSRKTQRACSGCSNSFPSPEEFRVMRRPKLRARSTKECHLPGGPRPRRPRNGREYVLGGQLQRVLSEHHAKRRGPAAAVQTVFLPRRKTV